MMGHRRHSENTCKLKDLPHLILYASLELFSQRLLIALISARMALPTDKFDLSSNSILKNLGGPRIPPWNTIFLEGGQKIIRD